MFSLDGKVALLTGAASGIGKATAAAYVESGASVVLADLNQDGIDEAVADLGDRAHGIACDVTDTAAADAAVAAAVDRFGRLDVLGNIAGMLRFEHTHEITDELWHQVIDVNLTGTFKMTRAALRQFLDQGGGSIINTTSSAAFRASVWASAYGAAKGGVLAFTRAVAVEYGRQGVRCNCVAPAGVKTPMIDEFRVPEGGDFSLVERIMSFDGPLAVDDVTGTYVFLGSDEADRINGACISVDDAMLA
ncbi:MAG: SDR family oxidoreductase [Acidimicrobiales bacterium]|nr:SDR family oxidoreductase [Acidimicrobiales bacterium]